MKTACCLGGNGFIAHHMARRLKAEGYFVRCVDIKTYEYGNPDYADEIVISDLRHYQNVESALRLQGEYSFYPKPFEEIKQFDLVFAFCCTMGGAGFVFTGDNDAEIIHDSALMNLHIAEVLRQQKFTGKLFYSSSACIYPQHIQDDPKNPGLKEHQAYPAWPDSEYGFEKLFSEHVYMSYARNHGLDIRIARFHNIYGPEGTFVGNRAKAPAAICRKIAHTSKHCNWGTGRGIGDIEIWGDGEQTRSFLYIDDCIDAVRLLMESDFKEPINIGSEEMVSINELVGITALAAQKVIRIEHIEGPTGVRGRNSNNDLIREKLNWNPKYSLKEGITLTYNWIFQQIHGIQK